MGIYLGSAEIKKAFLGAVLLKQIYLGGTPLLFEEKTETFTESADWTAPCNTVVSVVCIGGGGGAGGNGGPGGTGSPRYSGGYGYGGKRGELASGEFAVSKGANIQITVGTGGALGVRGSYRLSGSGSSAQYYGNSGSAGFSGDASSFGDYISAAGGAGGFPGQGAGPYGPGSPSTVQAGESGYEDYDNAGAGGDSNYAGGKGLVRIRYNAPA